MTNIIRDTSSAWTTANPVLPSGSLGIEVDTNRAKIGDGTNAWLSLKYTEYTQTECDSLFVFKSGDTITGDLIIQGDLTIQGTQTIVNSNNVHIGDSIITLNADETSTPTQNAGIEIERGTSTNVSWIWDEANDYWTPIGGNLGNINNLQATTFQGTLDLSSGNNTENLQDFIGTMVTSNVQNGIAVTYDDTSGKLNFDVKDFNISLTGDVSGSATVTNLNDVSITTAIANDSHSHTTSTITNFAEDVQDVVGNMVTSNYEYGIVVTYDDTSGKLNFDVNNFTIFLTGDVSGSATVTNLGDVSITTAVANDSHSHTTSTITNFAEDVQDVVGNMVTSNTENGIAVTYDDVNGKLNFDVNPYAAAMNQGVATTDSPTFAGVTTANLYGNGVFHGDWTLASGATLEATYADLAERYEADKPYEVGTVVVFGGEKEITACTQDSDVSVAGIVSANPAFKMNSDAGNDDTHPYIALKGRVPVKVHGPVKKGDLLVTSSYEGHARSIGKQRGGIEVFAKAITENPDGFGIIEAFVV